MTFNEAQEKLISEYSRDAIPEETSIRSKYYTLVTKDGKIGKRKNFIVDTKSKKTLPMLKKIIFLLVKMVILLCF